VQAVFVGHRVDGHGLDAHLLAGADDAHSDLAAVGDEDLVDGLLLLDGCHDGAGPGAPGLRGVQALRKIHPRQKLGRIASQELAAQRGRPGCPTVGGLARHLGRALRCRRGH
jgi:hypothetical protein